MSEFVKIAGLAMREMFGGLADRGCPLDADWGQSQDFLRSMPIGEQQRFQLSHDRDTEFSAEFRETMKEKIQSRWKN